MWIQAQVMQGGKIVQKGKFDELLERNIGFDVIVGAHSQALESVVSAESSSRISSDNQKSAYREDELDAENGADDQLQGITEQEPARDISHETNEKGRLTQDEEREKGGIGKKVYWVYLRTVHGGALVPITIAAQLLFQIFQVASNYWMAWASPPSSATNPTVGISKKKKTHSRIRPPFLRVYSTIYGKCIMYLRPLHAHITNRSANIRKTVQEHDPVHPACPNVLL